MFANGIDRVHHLVLCHLKALKALNINWEQAQEESASILNVLKALTLADIRMERINVFDYSCMSFGESLKHNQSK